MRRLIALALGATAVAGITVAVNKRRDKRDKEQMLDALAHQVAANAAKQVTTLDGRIALARAALKLKGSGILTKTILALMPADGTLTESCNIDALMCFMGQPVLMARELGYENVNDLTEAERQSLYMAIAEDSRFLSNCVLVAPTLINLPNPLDIPGDTLVALDKLLIQIRTKRTFMVFGNA